MTISKMYSSNSTANIYQPFTKKNKFILPLNIFSWACAKNEWPKYRSREDQGNPKYVMAKRRKIVQIFAAVIFCQI